MYSLIRALAATTPAMLAVFGDEALLRDAMRFEAELSRAAAAEGLIPQSAADLIATCCAEPVDVMIAQDAAFAGTLAIPLVAHLRARVAASDAQAATFVHRGGTSQDLADTALMLQAKAATAIILRDGARLAEALAALTRVHAATPMVGRTLMQSALPITFGLKTANWLLGVDAALARVKRESDTALALQFGGAAGTLAGMDGKAFAVGQKLAKALDLAYSVLPWQARRENVAGLASAMAILTGTVAKIARDISLMAQNEIAEAFEPAVPGRGGSSAMAHKRNPTGCQVVLSAALRAPGLAATIFAGLAQEHERGLGGWQAEAPVLADLLSLTHGAIEAMRTVVEGLVVDAAAMRRNLDRAGVGQDLGESVALARLALEAFERDR
jgi:3-carboxy-cis,cis-muconate cycloisomerase